MAIFYSPWHYLAGMAVWLVALFVSLRFLLKGRRKANRREKSARLGWFNAGLSTWTVLAGLTALELGFALFADFTDAANTTNISKRWIRRHIDGEQNNIGFRDARDFPKTLPEGVKRIAFFGDSFTAGHGVPDIRDRFSDRIAARLDETHPGEYVVANLGELGYETALIESLVQGCLQEGNELDIVIYAYMMNDIEGFDPRTTKVIQELQGDRSGFFLIDHTYFFNWLYFRMMLATGPRAGAYFSHLESSYDGPPWEALKRKLRELHQTCASNDVDFRMVLFPFLHNLGPGYPFRSAHAKLVAFCKDEGIPVLDLEPVLTPHVDEGLKVNAFDSHPNERAHELAAEAIEEQLLQDLFRDGE